MAWNVFKFCTALRALGSIMIVFVLAIIGVTYYSVVIAHYVPSLFLGGFETYFAVVALILFHSLLVMVMWCYSSVVVTDPGGVPPNWRPLTDEEKGDADSLVASGYGSAELDSKQLVMPGDFLSLDIRFCHKCKQFKPPRTHHCSVCGRCILKMDHHCVWVVNCVGAFNYKYFLLFLFYTFLETTLVSLLLLRVLMEFFNDGEIDETPGSLVATFITFDADVISKGPHFPHVIFQAYEKKTSPKWRYDLGWKKNFQQVFGLEKFWFIPVYSKEDLRRMPALQGFEYPTRPDWELPQRH
ncbi:probable protein S-acyltransferase 14 isoform X2 [Hibiscus syriacus]|uniref:probable protein S-acyltransferase 14 isoform X2 n=1 Tax=Hibiscus syriacus TaxID=106335 RepID=UPI00192332C4|nr:probable protein S-acyltransferase 14 isoform X2 [Hibiscus syriacus]